MSFLEVSGLAKTYSSRFGGNKVEALKNVNFTVEKGEYVAIMGESGSGKTTLLNILAALDSPTSGRVILDSMDLSTVKESQMAAFRRDNLGFVFQEFNLLDTFSAEDNILLPLVLKGENYKQMSAKLRPIADRLCITELMKKYPYELSGGQKQRVAVASAIASGRPLILFDEPTSGLDLFHMRQVANVVNQVANAGRTALVVTHDPEFILRCCNYVLHLENGQIQESYSIEDSDGRKRLLKFFLSDMKKEVSTE